MNSSPRKIALITGVTGQDGAYLAEFLLKKGYTVHGIKRRVSLLHTDRIDHLFMAAKYEGLPFYLHHGDLTDSSSLQRIMAKVQPHEIYNLAAQSHVAVSFEEPEYTANSDALGTLRLLEAMRSLGLEKSARFYQASTSELYGLVRETPQNENTPFYPRSPYGVAKLYAYWITVNYREAYGMHASNGILFNHESPYRGETFVTRKITRALARITVGLQKEFYLGNLDALRDWGHARDYVEMQWLMLQQDTPDDYVIATGEQHSVRDFVNASAKTLGITLAWEGKGIHEVGKIAEMDKSRFSYHEELKRGQTIIKINPRYFRPAEVQSLLGDASKAQKKIGWRSSCSFPKLVEEMTQADLELAQRETDYGGKGLKFIHNP